jgi:CRP/FNR family transcriptional regulator, cyclic AMP receptor protein
VDRVPIREFGVACLDRLFGACQLRRVAAKSLLIGADEAPDSLFLVVHGSLAVITKDGRGNEIIASYLNRGDLFGEGGLFQQAASHGTRICAHTECLLGEISYKDFLALGHSDPDVLFELAGQLAARLGKLTHKLRDMAFLDVSGRILGSLRELCLQPDALSHPDGMQIRVSRMELGRIVGCSREMAGRVLKSLEQRSLIAATGKTIVVFGIRPASSGLMPSRMFGRRLP